MRRVILLLAAMAAMVVAYAGAALAEEPTDTLDAHYLDATEVSYNGLNQNYQQGQTFTVENTGHLTRAEVKVWRTFDTTSDLRMKIVSVNAASGLPTNNVLASASLPASQIVTYGGGRMETFTFDNPAVVREGKKYAFVMDGIEGQTYNFSFEMDSLHGPSPGYPGGEGYWLNHDYTVLGAIPDHTFAVYVAPGDVPDVTGPVLSLPEDITKEAEGPNGATVSWSSPTATDDVDDSVTVNCDKPSGDTFPLGTTMVTCSATDAAGNTASGTFDVTVQDTTPPVISGMPSNITKEATDPSGATASWIAPTASDTVDGTVGVTCTPDSGSTFAIQTTTVTCSATDTAGNTSTGTFEVTVVNPDSTAPTVSSIDRTGSSLTNTTGNLSWRVKFSEDVTGVDTGDFALANNGLRGSPTISSVTQGANASVYTVTASTGTGSGTLRLDLDDDDSIKDGANNPLGGTGLGNGDFEGELYTLDRTAPKVQSTTPANNATGISRTANVTATFSEAMKKASVEVPGVVTLKTSSGGIAVDATVTYNATTKKVVIDPSVTLARNTSYTAKITTAATDRAGNKLDQDSTTSGNQAKSWKFTTAN